MTVAELKDILKVFGLFVNSNNNKKIWDVLKGHLIGLRHETPACTPTLKMYEYGHLEELFNSEVHYAKGNIWVYKNTSKRELDEHLFTEKTNKGKRILWGLLKAQSSHCTEIPTRMDIDKLSEKVGTKVVHCEATLLTYQTITIDNMRRIFIRTGSSTQGDKATLFKRFCKVLNA